MNSIVGASITRRIYASELDSVLGVFLNVRTDEAESEMPPPRAPAERDGLMIPLNFGIEDLRTGSGISNTFTL
ncbi:MAG: hypothetical protein ABI857_01780 [Acidobacteriota bacterium]